MTDSENKLCRLVSEFGRVCQRRKLRVNVGKSKVMRCSRYGNEDQMHEIPKRIYIQRSISEVIILHSIICAEILLK